MYRDSKNIIFLTVADPEIGLGHLFRCDALAQAIKMQNGEQPQLIVSCNAGLEWLESCAPNTPYIIANWNGDALETRSLISDAFLIIVDAYHIKDDVWKELRTNSSRLAVFDDTGEKPPFEGVLINGSPGAHLVGYKDIPGRGLLLGTDYQVLRPPFWERTERTVKENIKTVLIMSGGTDHRGIVDEIVGVAKKALPDNADIVVIGEMREIADSKVRSVGFLNASQLKEFFDDADLLITAAGQTVAEAVSCLLPTLMIKTADNQDINVKGWINSNSALFAGNIVDNRITKELEGIIHKTVSSYYREKMVLADLSLDLSNSAKRLASILSEV